MAEKRTKSANRGRRAPRARTSAAPGLPPAQVRKLLFRSSEEAEASLREPRAKRSRVERARSRSRETFESYDAAFWAAVDSVGFGHGWADPDVRRERELELEGEEQALARRHLDDLRAVLERLRPRIARARKFVGRASNATGAVEFLREWLDAYSAPIPIPHLGERGRLARIVRYYDGLAADGVVLFPGQPSRHFSNREMAETAIRLGVKVKVSGAPTPTKIIKATVDAVRKERRARGGE
jgi:hypothetical protein